jgi:hypothetical protein
VPEILSTAPVKSTVPVTLSWSCSVPGVAPFTWAVNVVPAPSSKAAFAPLLIVRIPVAGPGETLALPAVVTAPLIVPVPANTAVPLRFRPPVALTVPITVMVPALILLGPALKLIESPDASPNVTPPVLLNVTAFVIVIELPVRITA